MLGWRRSAVCAATARVREKVAAWESRAAECNSKAPVSVLEQKHEEHYQAADLEDEDQFLIKAVEAVASAGASRQVVAATLAAAVRLRREGRSGRPPVVEELVASRIEALRPVLAAQTVAGLATDLPKHRPAAALAPAVRLRANAARHSAFELGAPLGALSDAELRRLQRGSGRQPC